MSPPGRQPSAPEDAGVLGPDADAVLALARSGAFVESLRLHRQLVARCADAELLPALSRLTVDLAALMHARADLEVTRQVALQGLDLSRRGASVEGEVEMNGLLAAIEMAQGRLHESQGFAAHASALAERSALPEHLPQALHFYANVLSLLGDHSRAGEVALRAVEEAERRGQMGWLRSCLLVLVMVRNYEGRSVEAEQLCARVLDLCRGAVDPASELKAWLGRAEAARGRGDLEAAGRALQEAAALSDRAPRLRSTISLNTIIFDIEKYSWADAAREAERIAESHQGDYGRMAAALAFTARLAQGELIPAEHWERQARRRLPAQVRVEPDIALALERAVQVVLDDPDAPPRALALAARALPLAWPTWVRLGRDARSTQLLDLRRALSWRGAPVPLGPYDLLVRIGAGGMGEVWRARHVEDDTHVAIKLVTAATPRAETTRAALRAEVRAVARMSHANIIAIYDSGQVSEAEAAMSGGRFAPGTPYLVMELCEGSLLAGARPRPWPEVKAILCDLLRALAHAHARGLIHLDIKPDNVLIGEAHPPRLTDFGLARAIGEGGGLVAGTPAYMAPEQTQPDGRDLGPWTDLYALGGLAWAMLTGAPPFGTDDAREILTRKRTEDIRQVQPARPLPPGVRPWLDRLLARAPQARFQRASDALEALETLDGASPEPAGAWSTSALASASTWLLDEPQGLPPTTAPEAPPAPAPAPVALRSEALPDWRDPAERAVIEGLSLSTFGLRELPVAGREEEREALWRALGRGGPAAVLLTGPAGVGRSRLARWLSCRAQETGEAVVLSVGRGDLGPSLRALLRWHGLSGAALRRAVAEDLGLDDERQIRALAELCEPGVHRPSPPEPAERAAVLRLALAAVPARRPLLLVLDDAHDDPEALTTVAALLDDPQAPPVIALLTVRDDQLAEAPEAGPLIRQLGRRVSTVTIPLGPLPPSAFGDLLRSSLRLEPALAVELSARADGNPQLALALVEEWIQEGRLVRLDYGFALRGRSVEPSRGLLAPWERRVSVLMADLPAGAQMALEVAAALGVSFEERDWRAACARLGGGVPDVLIDRLLDRALAERQDGRWRLCNAMLREAVLRGARDAGRASVWHAAIAATLSERGAQAADVLIHLFEGDQLDAGLDLLERSARALFSDLGITAVLGALDAGDRALRRAATGPDDPRWLEVLLSRATASHRLSLREPALVHLAEAERIASLAGLPLARARALATRAAVLRKQGLLLEAERAFAEAAQVADPLGDEPLLASINYGTGMTLLSLGRAGEALGALEAAARLATASHGATTLSAAHMALGAAHCVLGHLDQARHHYVRCIEVAREGGTAMDLLLALNGAADLDRQLGDLDAAEAGYREALSLYSGPAGSALVMIRMNLSLIHIARGRYAEARALLETCRVELLRQGRLGLLAAALVTLLPTCLATGDRSAFDHHAAEAMRLLERTGFTDPDAIWAARQACSLLDPRQDEARREVLEALLGQLQAR